MNTRQPVNPYIAGSPVTGREMFFGREDVFDFIGRKLIGEHQDTPVVLYGQRRTGKTSVLYQLHRHLPPSYRCIFIDLHGLNLNGMGNLLLGIANSISRGLRRDHRLTADVPDRAVFLADPQQEFETTFLDAVWSALGEDHLVLMLDEVIRLDEEVKAGRLERGVFDYLRHLMQHHARLNFIFSLGSGLEDMEKEYAFLFSVSLYHRISFLERTAAEKLITQPVREHYQVAPQAAEKILQITSSHPYYTQLVCHCIFDLWSRSPKTVMDAADVDAVLAEAIELGSPNLTYVWEDSTPGERALMAGMAAAMQSRTSPVTFKDVQDAWHKVGVSLPERELARALQSLTAREVVMGSQAYSFTVDLQRLWLERHRHLDWVKEELAEIIQQWNRSARITRRGRYLAITAVIVLLVGVVTATAVAHVGPFSRHPDFDQLLQQLPGDLSQKPQECHPAPQPSQWSMPGLVQALHCTDPGLPGGNVYAYQLDSTAHYQTAWQNFNKWWGFLQASAAKTCPPPTGALQGVLGSNNNALLEANSELLECGPLTLSATKVVPAYVWDIPNDDIFVIAEGASGSSLPALASWLAHPSPTAHVELAAGVAPLVQLLPSDVNPANCQAKPKTGWALPGLVKSYACYDAGVGSGESIYAYQMNNFANYSASWANFNTFAGFSASLGSGCPPVGGDAQGSVSWDDTGSGGSGFYPAAAGQVLECGFFFANSNKQNEPTYAWSFPTEDAYIIAIGDANSTFSHLQSWWANNADPNQSPSPAAP